MPAQVPTWLKATIVDSLLRVGASASQDKLEAQAEWLLDLWSKCSTEINCIRYLTNLFEKLDAFDGIATDPAILRLAATYQIIDIDFGEKLLGTATIKSEKVRAELKSLGVDTEIATRIGDLAAMVAAGEFASDGLDSQILHDASFAVLATPPQVYAKYCATLARATSNMPREQFLKARARYLQAILHHRRIFRTPIGAKWSNALRNNFEGELARIQQSLGQVDTDSPTRPLVREAPATPIVIRSSRAIKQQRLNADYATDYARKKKKVDTDTEMTSSRVSAPVDEISSLEMADDPFLHRKRKK